MRTSRDLAKSSRRSLVRDDDYFGVVARNYRVFIELVARKRLVILLASLFLSYSFLGITLWAEALPPNPIQFEYHAESTLRMFVPEGWAFFSISARSKQYVAYAPTKNNTWHIISSTSSSDSFFGFSRRSRAMNVELGRIVTFAEQHKSYHSCPTSLTVCLAASKQVAKIPDVMSEPLICGPVAVVEITPVPWLWERQFKNVTSRDRIARFDSVCK